MEIKLIRDNYYIVLYADDLVVSLRIQIKGPMNNRIIDKTADESVKLT